MSSFRLPRAVLGAALLGISLLGCAAHHAAPAPPADEAAIVLGLESDDVGAILASVHLTATVGGVVQSDQTIAVTGKATFPKEVRLTAPAPTDDAPVVVKLEAFPPGNGGPSTTPILRRLATTRFVKGQTKLLRLRLDARCLTGLGGGGLGAPTCEAPTTCISGTCRDQASDVLEDYVPNWALDAPDICRPVGHGDPEVIVGTGQTDYLPVANGQTIQAELGPQGGHHVWIAVRMRNLKQSGSTITITAVQPSSGSVVPPTAFVFTFDRDEGGYCKLSGLRFQLDNGATDLRNDYKKFLGAPLDITVEVADPAGSRAKATAHVNIASTLLCPNGTTSCN